MFSKATEYALRATIYIAQKGSQEKKLGLAEIAKAIDSPKSFTAKILQKLTKDNKVVSSFHGPNGGFYITDKAKELPVSAILKAVDEDDILTKCILGLKECSERRPCAMHNQYKYIKQELIQLFEARTIQDLASEIRNGNIFIGNGK